MHDFEKEYIITERKGVEIKRRQVSHEESELLENYVENDELDSILSSYTKIDDYNTLYNKVDSLESKQKNIDCKFPDDKYFVVREDHLEKRVDSSPNNSVQKPKYTVKKPGNDYVYMANHANPGFITSYDVSCSNKPNYLDEISVNNGPNSLKIQGNYVYAATNTGRLVIIDVSDPKNISKVSSSDFGGQMFDIDISSNLACMAGAAGDGLVLVDISDKSNPQLHAKVTFPAGGVRINGDYAFITNYDSKEIRSYDISNPISPSLSDSLSIGSFPVQVEYSNNVLYVGEYSTNTFYVLNASDPSNLSISKNITINNTLPNTGGISPTSNYLYIFSGRDGNGSLEVFDNSSPLDPQYLFEYFFKGSPLINPPVVDGKYAYIPRYTDNEFMTFKLLTEYNNDVSINKLKILNSLTLKSNKNPSSSSDSGVESEIRIGEESGSYYLYVYIDGSWRRTQLSTW